MQEHAEGPRSQPLVVCKHCGARNEPKAGVCKKCETPLDRPGMGKKG